MSFDVPDASPRADRALRHEASADRARPELFRRRHRVRRAPARTGRSAPTEHPYADGNYRIIGVADMAHAIRSGRPHRASGELAFHVLEVMEAFQTLLRHAARTSTIDDAGPSGRRCCRPSSSPAQLD